MISRLIIKKGKIFCFFVSFFLLTGTVSFAKPVSVYVAKQVAKNFMMQQTGIEHEIAKDSIPLLSTGERQDEITAYYMFNMDPEGWVIVAGDDIAFPVIGYATKEAVNADDVPPAFSEWMTQIKEHIIQVVREEHAPLASVEAAWKKLKVADHEVYDVMLEAVGPLVKTTWSQGKYYNKNCPVDLRGYDGHALVGCCATALGQIMKYHNWPPTGTGSHSYFHQEYGTLSANFDATNYNWNSIPSTGKVTSHNNGVATLLYHIGVSMDMNYGPAGSGCSPSKIAPGLGKYFKYKPVSIVSRSAYSDSEWLAKIKNDLNTKGPIIYVGKGTSGHAFVCDGYRSEFFHFNWGWNGFYNGYFYLNDLTPGGYYNYTYYQRAIFGIEPQDVPVLAGVQLLLSNGNTSPPPPSCPAMPNGDFESGRQVSWIEYSASNSYIVAPWGIAHSGTWSALLGDVTAYIQQQVTVPSSCPHLVFYHWIDSYDSCGNDYGFVRINEMNVKTIQLCTNNNTSGWVRQVVDLSSYANQAVTIEIRSETDDMNQSYWYIDDVSFQASTSADLVKEPIPLKLDTVAQLNTQCLLLNHTRFVPDL